MGEVRNSIGELYRVRAKRLSDEALGLAPTHMEVMTFLSILLLFGFALATVATAQTNGVPSGIAHILFSALTVCYVLLYEMAYDLNRPYDGVYCTRRSPAAVHFLQIKRLISNDPDLSDTIDFELEIEEDDIDFLAEDDWESHHHSGKRWYDGRFD